MNELISVELLSDVLGVEVVRIGEFNGSNLQVYIEHLEYADYYEIAFKRKNDWFSTINIHELAHKCKEWAVKKEYHLWSRLNQCQVEKFESSHHLGINIFKADTEPEAIIKACEWLKEQL